MLARDYDVRLARYQGSARRRRRARRSRISTRNSGPTASTDRRPLASGPIRRSRPSSSRFADVGRWQGAVDGSYRTHGDHFIYDVRQPSLSESRTARTPSRCRVACATSLDPRTQMSFGVSGGRDTIDSSNLGDHGLHARERLCRACDAPSARRAGRPAGRPGGRLHPLRNLVESLDCRERMGVASTLKWRASGGHAFRVPTFTELYYRDPNHQASEDLSPETAWSATSVSTRSRTAGPPAPPCSAAGSRTSSTGCARRRPTDGGRPTSATSRRAGVEDGLRAVRDARDRHVARATPGSTRRPTRSICCRNTCSTTLVIRPCSPRPRPGDRSRSAHVSNTSSARTVATTGCSIFGSGGRSAAGGIYAEAANLLDTSYEEIRGVAMPGRWVKAGVRVR